MSTVCNGTSDTVILVHCVCMCIDVMRLKNVLINSIGKLPHLGHQSLFIIPEGPC